MPAKPRPETAAGGTLTRRALRLEYATIGWNAVEAVVAVAAGLAAGSIALVGFGLDSSIEIFAAGVVVWRFHGTSPEREAVALRLIGVSFLLLAAYVGGQSIVNLVAGATPDESTVGIVLTALSLVVMPVLAYGKSRTAAAMGSRVLEAEAAETWLCAWLSAIVLGGLALNAWLGWWWADPVAGLGITALAVREGREAWEAAGHH